MKKALVQSGKQLKRSQMRHAKAERRKDPAVQVTLYRAPTRQAARGVAKRGTVRKRVLAGVIKAN
jgi:hypothetical protein